MGLSTQASHDPLSCHAPPTLSSASPLSPSFALQDSFDEYFAEMPWAAVPFDSDMREAISTKFDIAGIPRLIVLDAATGAVVNEDARAAVTSSKKLAGVF